MASKVHPFIDNNGELSEVWEMRNHLKAIYSREDYILSLKNYDKSFSHHEVNSLYRLFQNGHRF
jgi:hypothetical protein